MFTVLIVLKYTTQWHSQSQCIHNVMEPSPPFIPQTFSSSTTETLYPRTVSLPLGLFPDQGLRLHLTVLWPQPRS